MMTWKMTLRRRSFPLAVVASCCLPNTIVSTHVYSDSFPTNDEYDFNILDPHHVYGSPYGGFSRATRSRLAALPLVLPGTVGEYSAEKEEEEPFYMEMRNGDGRLFVCRVYHEDELTATSLGDSMFTTAELKYTASVDDDNEGEEPVENTKEEPVVQEEETPQRTSTTGASSDEEKLSNAMEMMQVLSKLDGVCTQIHKGWWSYEWCHGNKVTQFHVHVESGKPQQIQLESVTNLGAYSTSTVYDDGDPDEENKPVMNKLVADKIKEIEGASEDDDTKELAVVVQDFIHGDICDETQAPRTTKVKLKCCPLKRMNRLKRAVLFDGQPVASNIAAITKMQETSVCNYYIEVCTPLLCEGLADMFPYGLVAKEVAKGTDPKLVPTPLSREKKGTESIREIIDGSLRNVCLRFFNGGWWVYELCHRRHVRQFHEADSFDPKTGSYSKVPEDIYMLGTYSKDELDGFPEEDEPKYVTNPSGEKEQQIGVTKNKGIKHDVGAYFVQEYKKGDVCDHSDVTDAAIKAGNVGEGGIERATTVRFFCGEKIEMRRVSEDSTCHYVVDVALPDLCEHKLFKAPVAKKQVIKCLPVDETQESK